MTIGERTAQEIKKRVKFGKVLPELKRLTIPTECYYRWKRGRGDPQAHYLRILALEGYDIHYILTGQKQSEEETDFLAEYEEEYD